MCMRLLLFLLMFFSLGLSGCMEWGNGSAHHGP
jgi:hypothetical protein